MRNLSLANGFNSSNRHTEEPLIDIGNAGITPSLDTVQQVDNAESQREREFRRVSQHKSERWRLRTSTKQKIVQRLSAFNPEAADKLARCCATFRHVTCGQHTVKSYPTFRCKKLFCPDCAAERAARLSSQIEAKLIEVLKTNKGRLCFLTLTLKNTPTLEGGLRKLKNAFTKFRRRKDFKKHIKGFFGAFEFTFNPKTKDFHIHLHLIVLRGAFWSQEEISKLWREVTGDSFIVDIRDVRNTHAGVKELCKYIAKPLDLVKMPIDKFREVVELKRGTRMFVSGGCFYNVKLDDADDPEGDIFTQFAELAEGDPCPFCKEPLFDVYVNREAHIGLYQLNAMPSIVKNNSS
jgi:hypothetical protein